MTSTHRLQRAWGALAVLAVLVVVSIVCWQRGGRAPVTEPSAATAPPATHRLAFLGEVRSELAGMRTSRYQHTTEVDPGRGEYLYDCSGLVDYALGRSVPDALSVLPMNTKERPLAEDIEQHLRAAPSGPGDPWQSVPTAAQLMPGDVIAWLTPQDSDSNNTGHTMVVTGTPTHNPRRAEEWLVPVIDSTTSGHANDSRGVDSDGLGTGTIGLIVDGSGSPTGYYWRGGVSTKAARTEVALGRLR